MKPLVTKGWNRDIIKEYRSGKLPILTINMTRECNLDCIYCHTDAGEKDKNELNSREWIKIIDESKELGNEVLWIGGRGEPLLDRAFEDVIKHANDIGLTTILNTNGTLITKDKAKFLYENNVSPEVKIISFDEDIYDYLAGTKGKLPFLRQGLKNMIETGYGQIIEETDDSRVTRISGMLLLAKPAYKSMPEVFKFCAENNFTPSISDVVAAGRVVKNRNLEELKLTEKENEKLLEKGSKIMGYPLKGGFEDCHIQYGVFVQNNGHLIVDRFGMSCDVCDYEGRRSIGNLRGISLKEGWELIKNERKKNEKYISRAYDEFRCYSNKCFSACPMALQSQKDYYSE
ncbi:MAG: radical SAM protein [archaeon]|nr:MAG: radical SAM protein [archaeon]